MKILIIILLLILAVINAQKVDLKYDFSKTDKMIITGFGATVMAIEFAFDKPQTKQEFNQKVLKCSVCFLFAVLPNIKRIEVNSSGINYKLKYKKFKCKYHENNCYKNKCKYK